MTGRDPAKDIAYSNTLAYRALVPMEVIRANGVKTDMSNRPVCFMGMGRVRYLLVPVPKRS